VLDVIKLYDTSTVHSPPKESNLSLDLTDWLKLKFEPSFSTREAIALKFFLSEIFSNIDSLFVELINN
jgi:hypothetical protein